MIRYFLSAPVLLISFCSFSQQLSHVSFVNSASLSSISFKTDQNIIIRISEDGKILQWGTEPEMRRYNYIPGQLDQYMGRVDYYGPEGDSISRGKVKSIGTCMFSYYGVYEQDYKIGKLKSVGAIQLDYYTNYDNVAYRGKLKTANSMMFTWYSSFDNEAIRGKLKSVNNTPIVYYTSFDDKQISGKLKSIGSYTYNWYSSTNRWQGNTNTTSPSQFINGITYIVGY